MHKIIGCDYSLGRDDVTHQKVALSRTEEGRLFLWQNGFLNALTATCGLVAPVIVYDPVYVVVSDTTQGNRPSFLVTYVDSFCRHTLLLGLKFEHSEPRSSVGSPRQNAARKGRSITLCKRLRFSADRGAWQILSGSPPRVCASTASRKTPIKSQSPNPKPLNVNPKPDTIASA